MTAVVFGLAPALQVAGLVIMAVSITGIVALVTYCYWRLLRRRGPGDG